MVSFNSRRSGKTLIQQTSLSLSCAVLALTMGCQPAQVDSGRTSETQLSQSPSESVANELRSLSEASSRDEVDGPRTQLGTTTAGDGADADQSMPSAEVAQKGAAPPPPLAVQAPPVNAPAHLARTTSVNSAQFRQREAETALPLPSLPQDQTVSDRVLPDQLPISSSEFNREEYNPIQENTFISPQEEPLSTFSIDVDAASYSNMRRFITSGQIPPRDAIRIEEMINYFSYDYPDPDGDTPFTVVTEISQVPWNPHHQLVHIGLQGQRLATEDLPPSNLVFLMDVSGSMNEPNKLPLLKSAFRLLVDELDAEDTVSIVVYAGAAGVVLEPTPGDQKLQILEAIERLEAGGSTAGGEGIQRAYELARQTFLREGNNRVILATDGDFNVGLSSEGELVQLIEEKREANIFLTVLGFGTGNLQDAKMEQLADQGNGNYAYIDSLQEARKVMVSEMGATLFSIAKDVKLQIEFNPAQVQAYRLIGYENRMLESYQFNDDTKDAGELGAGHSVTALYEIIPVGVETPIDLPGVDPLRYQQTAPDPASLNSEELMWVKLRYKQPTADVSQLLEHPVLDLPLDPQHTTDDFRFSAAVAGFGMILRDSEYRGATDTELILKLAEGAIGEDRGGYRREFVQLVNQYEALQR